MTEYFDRPGRRRMILAAAAAAVLVVGALALIGKAAHYAELRHRLASADGTWFPLLVVGEVVAYLGYTLAYRGTARARGGPRLPFFLTLRVVAASFGGAVLAAGIGGLAVDYWALQRAGEAPRRALARILAFNTLEWAMLGGGAVVAAIAEVLGVGKGAPFSLELGWLAGVGVAYALAVVFTTPRRALAFASLEDRGRIRTLFAAAIAGVVIVREILRHPVRHAEAVAGTALYWAGLMTALWGGLRAFGAEVGLTALVLGFATGYAASMLPLPAGGAGGIDAAMTYALNLVGVPLAEAVLGVFAYRFFTFWLPLVPAIASGATLHDLRERLPHVPRPEGRPSLVGVVQGR